MAATTDRVKYAATTAKPYLGRALTDEEFRDNLRAAFAAARAIYEELGGRQGIASAASQVATSEDVHANLRRAIGELRQAADRLQQEERKARSHAFRNAALLFGGVAIGLFFNPLTGRATRRWVAGKASARRQQADEGSPNGSAV
jgi:hypothetical protein